MSIQGGESSEKPISKVISSALKVREREDIQARLKSPTSNNSIHKSGDNYVSIVGDHDDPLTYIAKSADLPLCMVPEGVVVTEGDTI